MTSSPLSGSDAPASTVFDLLHEGVRRWIYNRRWRELRPIQERTARVVLAGDQDVLISAATAGGKTEAAFLPIASRLAEVRTPGFSGLAVIPLKALINDQHPRLESLFAEVGLEVHRWHGDVSGNTKRKLKLKPSGLLLITPESLEALFVLQGPRIPTLFAPLRFVVVDEVHSFIGTERGRQLQSLLGRVERAVGHRVPRVALSATLGDLGLAAEFLRPGQGGAVARVTDDGRGTAIRLLIKGYEHRVPMPRAPSPATGDPAEEAEEETEDDDQAGIHDIARHMFAKLRTTNNLIFANSRARVELLADRLRRLSEATGVPNEFFPHHGSLAKDIREEAERRMKSETLPANIVCTSTLELGIDVGLVSAVAQVGCPPSVSSMRQRLGRSGRRGDQPATLWMYVTEPEIVANSPLIDRLRPDLVQAVAMVELLNESWCEPPEVDRLHLSTLVQQLLSSVAQHGGIRPREAWAALCVDGPFDGIDQSQFAALLRELGRRELLTQTSDGDLALGLVGERIVDHYTFFSAFSSPEEYRLESHGRPLGTMPITQPVYPGLYLIFGGRRWRVETVDPQSRLVQLSPAGGGRAPSFSGTGARVHDRIRDMMRRVLAGERSPQYLDSTATRLLAQAQATYRDHALAHESLVAAGSDTLVFAWAGDRVMHTLTLALAEQGLDVTSLGLALLVTDRSPDHVRAALRSLRARGQPEPTAFARRVENQIEEKYDQFLPTELLAADYASRALDVDGAWRCIRQFAG